MFHIICNIKYGSYSVTGLPSRNTVSLGGLWSQSNIEAWRFYSLCLKDLLGNNFQWFYITFLKTSVIILMVIDLVITCLL